MSPRSFDGIRRVPVRFVPAYAPPPVPKAPEPPATPKPTYRAPYRAILCYSLIGGYLYLVAAPVLPRFTLPKIGHTAQALESPPPQPTVLASVPADATPAPRIEGPNRLSFPGPAIEGEIYDGATDTTLNKGIWHIPGTSTPDKGGNTVLAAHRFMFLSGANTFYNLDKANEGDRFEIIWDGVGYTYEVYETKVVTSRSVEIEEPTEESIVTLYTCTPLWTSKDRLVVRARLVH